MQTVLAVTAVLILAFLDGRSQLKGTSAREKIVYGAILIIGLTVIVSETLLFQPFIVSKAISTVFTPLGETVLNALRRL